jgi:hypothetical protein
LPYISSASPRRYARTQALDDACSVAAAAKTVVVQSASIKFVGEHIYVPPTRRACAGSAASAALVRARVSFCAA